METGSVDKTMFRLAKTSLAERQRARNFVTTFCAHAATQPEGLAEMLKPFLQPKPTLDRGEVPDVPMEVDVEIVGGLEHFRDQHKLLRVSEELEQKDVQELLDLEPRVLAWLAEKSERQAEFVADPLGTLARSDLGISPELLKRLGTARKQKFAAIPLVPLHLTRLTVKASEK